MAASNSATSKVMTMGLLVVVVVGALIYADIKTDHFKDAKQWVDHFMDRARY
jgi:uncharacterized membrane protein